MEKVSDVRGHGGEDVVIRARHLVKTYRLYDSHSDRVKETFHPFRRRFHREFYALNDVSFELRRGDSVGIIGRNGSGKSTLLQLLCGVLQPSAGEITTDGRVSALLELGAGFNPEFTGRENVFMNRTILGVSEADTEGRFASIEEFADIGEFIDQPVKTYSSGMYIRLAFATAISIDPEILIIDEALAVGDIFFQQKCMSYMKGLSEKATVVFVTHDMQAVVNLCGRVLVLDRGRVTFDGSPLDAVSHYTRIVHDERFGGGGQKKTEAAAASATPALEWKRVPAAARGGRQDVVITGLRFLRRDGNSAEIICSGDDLLVQILLSSAAKQRDLIFGYTVKDRVGNAIFGENTLSSLGQSYEISPGESMVEMGFSWPEVHPDDYTITFGVGQGDDAFDHVIQCWAHNIFSFSTLTPGRRIHGLFNNPILDCRVAPAGSGNDPGR